MCQRAIISNKRRFVQIFILRRNIRNDVRSYITYALLLVFSEFDGDEVNENKQPKPSVIRAPQISFWKNNIIGENK